MERLDLLTPPENRSIEAAIHVARYAAALPLVRGKRVLDAACGEGYGTALLMQAGAAEVVGVDIAQDSIAKARETFGDSGARFEVLDVERLADHFTSGYFDVVVSIETVEHVQDCQRFLEGIRTVATDNAVFYVTCPNDHWYYPQPEQSNPYHLRKFTFEEFSDLSRKVLGDNVDWALGSAALGFAAYSQNAHEQLHGSWMSLGKGQTGFAVENDTLHPVDTRNCSYFAGLWNSPDVRINGGGHFPISMDAYSRIWEALTSDLVEKSVVDDLRHENRHKGLRLAAVQAENQALRDNVQRLNARTAELQASVEEMSAGYWRYQRISGLFPQRLKTILIKTYRLMKRG